MFFGVLGLSGLRILLRHFWSAPLQRPKEKKVRKKKIDLKWVQTCAKPRFIEIKIEKRQFLIGKKSTPNYPKIFHVVPGPPAVQGSGGAH